MFVYDLNRSIPINSRYNSFPFLVTARCKPSVYKVSSTFQDTVIALWDTEGPSDPNQPQDHALTIFALSAYFSQVLIYNVDKKFSDHNMDKIQVVFVAFSLYWKNEMSL